MNFKGSYLLLISLLYCLSVCSQEPITLDKALDIAEINSPSLQKTKLSREQSRQTLIAQKAALKAKASLNVAPLAYNKGQDFNNQLSDWYTYNSMSSTGTFELSQPILLTNSTVSLSNKFGWQNNASNYYGTSYKNKAFINELNLTLKQPLFCYNSQKMNLKEIELRVENAEIEYRLQQLFMEQRVTTLFYNVFMAQLNLDIAREELNNTRVSRTTIADKVGEGLAANIELYQADLNLSAAKSTVLNRKVALENARAYFRQFIGMDLNDSINVAAAMGDISTLKVNIQEAINYGLKNRMELRQRKIAIENEQFVLTRAEAVNKFNGSISLSFGLIGNDEMLNRIYQTPNQGLGVAVSLNIPIWDWGERKARIKAQHAVIKCKTIDYESEQTQIQIEISEICRNMENYRSQIEIEKQNQRNAQMAYEISLEKYRNGDLTSMDLNLYQTQLSSKKISLAQAQVNYKLELLNLKIVSLYDFEKSMPIITVEKNK
jgi:outer membrane protein